MKKLLMLTVLLVSIFSILNANDIYKVIKDKCIGCNMCIKKCPVKAIYKKEGKVEIDSSKCIGCGLCVSVCPTKAIIVKENITSSALKEKSGEKIYKEIYTVKKDK